MQDGLTYCDEWGQPYRTNINDFAGLRANTKFFLQVAVVSPIEKGLNPPITPAGRSSLDVVYAL